MSTTPPIDDAKPATSPRPAPTAADVSVVVPVYNSARFIRDTLLSIARQTQPPGEVLVVDDGSSDASVAVVSDFCREHPSFRLLQQANRGASAARNLGVEHARGSWVALCDADDLWREDRLERQLAFIREHQNRYDEPLIAVGASAYFINAGGEIISRFQKVSLQSVEEFKELRARHEVINLITSTLMFRRDACLRVGGYSTRDPVANDIEFTTRLADHGIMLNLPEPLAFHRLHGDSLSDAEGRFIHQRLNGLRIRENARRRAEGREEIDYPAFVAQLEEDPEGHARRLRELRGLYHFRLASSALGNRQLLRGGRRMLRALWVSPGPIAQRLWGHLAGGNALGRLAGLLAKRSQRAAPPPGDAPDDVPDDAPDDASGRPTAADASRKGSDPQRP